MTTVGMMTCSGGRQQALDQLGMWHERGLRGPRSYVWTPMRPSRTTKHACMHLGLHGRRAQQGQRVAAGTQAAGKRLPAPLTRTQVSLRRRSRPAIRKRATSKWSVFQLQNQQPPARTSPPSLAMNAPPCWVHASRSLPALPVQAAWLWHLHELAGSV